MILELDCGNSFIKWRVVTRDTPITVVAKGVVNTTCSLQSELLAQSSTVSHCRLVSVRSDDETRLIVNTLVDALGIDVVCAAPAAVLGGVTNGYTDFNRLGLDRWLAVVGAYNLCRSPCVIIDLGTAVTIDLVGEGGKHLGGYITPGMALLTEQLRTHTRRILYDADEAKAALSDSSPGRSTSEAVERGCLKMLCSYIEAQIADAARYLGKYPVVYVTGGDASLFAEAHQVQSAPDLVFQGLAIACPI